MRLIMLALMLSGFFALAGCDTNGALQGSGTGNSGAARAKIGVPF